MQAFNMTGWLKAMLTCKVISSSQTSKQQNLSTGIAKRKGSPVAQEKIPSRFSHSNSLCSLEWAKWKEGLSIKYVWQQSDTDSDSSGKIFAKGTCLDSVTGQVVLTHQNCQGSGAKKKQRALTVTWAKLPRLKCNIEQPQKCEERRHSATVTMTLTTTVTMTTTVWHWQQLWQWQRLWQWQQAQPKKKLNNVWHWQATGKHVPAKHDYDSK